MYLYADDCQEAHPEAKILRMGIGDVTRPLPPTVIKAMQTFCLLLEVFFNSNEPNSFPAASSS